jgi:uncharacterized protein (DUF2267 family)
MTYQEFLRRVQDQAGLSSADDAGRAVAATLETLARCVSGQGIDALPQEIRQLLPAELMSASSGQQWNEVGGEATNPQLAGETRVESGGESTAESGQ